MTTMVETHVNELLREVKKIHIHQNLRWSFSDILELVKEAARHAHHSMKLDHDQKKTAVTDLVKLLIEMRIVPDIISPDHLDAEIEFHLKEIEL